MLSEQFQNVTGNYVSVRVGSFPRHTSRDTFWGVTQVTQQIMKNRGPRNNHSHLKIEPL